MINNTPFLRSFVCVLLVSLYCIPHSFAETATGVAAINDALVQRIDEAQTRLTNSENKVAQQRQKLAAELGALEQEVIELRRQIAVSRRASDEKTLSLTQLESRLDTWQQQNQYQRNLLLRFLQQHPSSVEPSQTGSNQQSTSNHIQAVLLSSERLLQKLRPQWESRELILDSGEVVQTDSLSAGPVIWYLNQHTETAGLASVDGTHGLRSDLEFTGSRLQSIKQLRESSIASATSGAVDHAVGNIVFDPTLSRATAKQQHTESVLEHVQKGGLWALPIILFAAFALSIACIKVLQLWRLPAVVHCTPSMLHSLINRRSSAHSQHVKGMQRQLLDIAMNSSNSNERDDLLFMQLDKNRHTLERWIGAIAVTAAVSPLLGLLGTVSGMIETFKMMTLFGSGDPEVVSGGIAQALVTTELGLVVAIPALVLNALLSRRAKHYYAELESFAILISNQQEPNLSLTPTQAPRSPARKTEVRQEVPA